MENLSYQFKLLAGLLAVLNPVGAIPMFASMTEGRSRFEKHSVARRTAFTVASVLMLSAVFGELILDVFGISLASFRVGGGILILLMSIAMLHARRTGAKQSKEESLEAMTRSDIAVVPFGIPLLAGPGAISTVILYRHNTTSWVEYTALIGVLLTVSYLVYLSLRYSTPLIDRLGRTGLNIIMRVMGLILAAIAVEFIADGLKMLFPLLQ